MSAFSYPLTMPSHPKPRSANYRLMSAQVESKSPFSFSSQVASWGGQQWEVDLDYPPMTKVQARSWVAFLLELRGKTGTFYFHPPEDPVLGIGGGSPIVSTAIDIAKISITGAPVSTAGWLASGDYFSFANGELKRVIGNVDTDGSGHAQIIYQPNSRQAPSPTSQIATTNAKGIFCLVSPNIQFSVELLQLHGIRLVIEEAIRV